MGILRGMDFGDTNGSRSLVLALIVALGAAGCASSVCLTTKELSARRHQHASREAAAIARAFAERGWTEIEPAPPPMSHANQELGEAAGHGWFWQAAADPDAAALLVKSYYYNQPTDYMVRTRDGRYLTVAVDRVVTDEERVLWCECSPGMGTEPPPVLQAFALPSRESYAGHQVLGVETTSLIVEEKRTDPGICHAAP